MFLSIERGCEDLLRGFDLHELEKHASSIVGVMPDSTIFYVNSAWFRFARLNGGAETIARQWSLGTNWLACVPDDVRPGFETLLEQALHQPMDARSPVQHCYECSSPQIFREYMMTLHPLGEGEGVLMRHSMISHRPHSRPSYVAAEDVYRQPDGMLHQCIYCRRMSHPATEQRWDWVPAWVESVPADTSHTICGICTQYYYASIGLPAA